MKPRVLLFAFLVISAFCLLYFKAFEPSKECEFQTDPAFSTYVSAYSGIAQGVRSGVRVVFAASVPEDIRKNESLDFFDLSPEVEGKTVWLNEYTLEFQPKDAMKADHHYHASVALDKLFGDVPEKFRDFEFHFTTRKQDVELDAEGIQVRKEAEGEVLVYKGTVFTADAVRSDQLEDALKISGAENIKVQWNHPKNSNAHGFQIMGLKKKKTSFTVELQLDGDALGINKKIRHSFKVPAADAFELLCIKKEEFPERFIRMVFSSPLLESQNLNGLIHLDGDYSVRYWILDNELRLYPNTEMQGEKKLFLSGQILNDVQKSLGTARNYTVHFDGQFPAIEGGGEGVIIPDGADAQLSFRAIHLKSVFLDVVEIIPERMHQFLQSNALDGYQSLSQTGNPVVRKRISLQSSGIARLDRWNAFTIRLGQYFPMKSGHLYHTSISFNREDVDCECPDRESNLWDGLVKLLPFQEDERFTADSWFYDGEQLSYGEGYDWEKKDDPCNEAFYDNHERFLRRNVLRTDLGLTAKLDQLHQWHILVTDIQRAGPLSGVEILLMDYQQRIIARDRTNAEGLVVIKPSKKPFMVLARRAHQQSFLRLDEGSSLSLSNFDVGGEEASQGLKGFLYTERGVWRPGDSIFVGFMLNDEDNPLPDHHPVLFELTNPLDQVVRRTLVSQHTNHLYTLRLATEADAPVGNWLLKAKVGNAEFTKRLKIEMIKPNRLRMNLNFGRTWLKAGDTLHPIFSSSWLLGRQAAGLRAYLEANFQKVANPFTKYEDFTFSLPNGNSGSADTKVILDGILDKEGTSQVSIPLPEPSELSPFLSLQVRSRVFEPGGEFSSDRFSIPYFPYSSMVGFQMKGQEGSSVIPTNKTVQFDVVALQPNGALSSTQVEVEVFKLNWKWWWEENEDEFNFLSADVSNRKKVESITLNKGEGKWSLLIKPSEWGRYLVRMTDKKSGHQSGMMVYAENSDGFSDGNSDRSWANVVNLKSSKSAYKKGEEIQVSLPAISAGQAFVSLENGSRIIKSFWSPTQAGPNVIRFRCEADMDPIVYVHVSLFQPYKSISNDMPIRMYGVLPIQVENPEARLMPELKMANELKPDKDFVVQVSEKNGKAMTYTLALVDEGLLDLTHFKTPDPYSAFHVRQALGIRTWDLYDQVYHPRIQSGKILAAGGDEEAGRPKGSKANRFVPVVRFLGPFTLKAGQSDKKTIHMPHYLGSVRVMLVAGQKGSYGSAEKTAKVVQPLMMLPTAPRFLRPGDQVDIPITLFNTLPKAVNAQVSVKTEGKIPQGERSVQLNAGQESTLQFPVSIPKISGAARLNYSLKSNQVNYSQNLEVPVLANDEYVQQVQQIELGPGKQIRIQGNLPGAPGTNSILVQMSSISSVNLSSRVDEIFNYGFGSAEQLASKGLACLMLREMMQPKGSDADRMNQFIQAVLQRLVKFQTPNGGFSYWAKGNSVDDWASIWVGNFLAEAKSAGYALPMGMLNQWKTYQTEMLGGKSEGSIRQEANAWRVSALSKAGYPDLSAMNRLREDAKLSLPARWQLSAAYHFSGQKSLSRAMALQLSGFDLKAYSNNPFASDLALDALQAEQLLRLGEERKAMNTHDHVIKSLNSNQYLSSFELACCLLEYRNYFRLHGQGNPYSVILTRNQKVLADWTGVQAFNSLNIKGAENKDQIALENKGKQSVYLTIIKSGLPLEDPQKAANAGLSCQITYKDEQGRALDPRSIPQGIDFIAEVSVKNLSGKSLYPLAMKYRLAAGWESLESANSSGNSDNIEKEFMDDQVRVYFGLGEREIKKFQIRLHSTYSGSFLVPAFDIRSVYQPGIFVRGLRYLTVSKK